MRLSRNVAILGVVAVLAVIGVAIGVTMVGNESVGSSSRKSQTDANTAPSGGRSSTDFASSMANDGNGKAGEVHGESDNETPTMTPDVGGESSPSTASSITSDPESQTYSVYAFAIGDWGVSPGGDSCCSKYKRTGEAHHRDEQAQDSVAYLMSLLAEERKPELVISHGDNFYWNGIGIDDAKYRFENAFESKYNQESLRDVKWINVMGNHDYGGSGYLCGNSEGNWRACKSVSELEEALENRFRAQADYKSYNGDRWKLTDRFYTEKLSDDGDVTVDIYNVDTNAAGVHGAAQICCQCYAYQGGVKKTDPDYVDCRTVTRGHKLCFGGSTEMYDTCMNKFYSWTEDSLQKLEKDAGSSKAVWKIVNSHYSPHFHFSTPMMDSWFNVLKDTKVQVFINGHTHAEGHDLATFNTHFVMNGAGGGVQSESFGDVPGHAKDVITSLWRAIEGYGFFDLAWSKDWMRMRYITFDEKWRFAEDAASTTKGSYKVAYCWYVPRDGTKGKPCSA